MQLGTSLLGAFTRYLDKRVWRVLWTLLRQVGVAAARERSACTPVRVQTGRVEVMLIESAKHPGSFIFPGGGIDSGETPERAAHRELLEEAGVSGGLTRLGEYTDTSSQTRTHIFLVRVDTVDEQWLEGSLGRRRQWFALHELDAVTSKKGVHAHTLSLLRSQDLTP
ncbi:NUDIX hydrolase domain-like protein [Pavlovales sp. CCMP2436]|nr:NUDIX hydrolase domain-like protein [Pavlovales sp. CCMP2436]